MSVVYSGTYTTGVVLADPATQNPATVTATGYITNVGTPGIPLLGEAGVAWSIDNYGTIPGRSQFAYGVSLASGGSITNAEGALIQGGPGVGNSLKYGQTAIAVTGGAGTVVNSGTIEGTVRLAAGGTVSNGAGGYVSGFFAKLGIVSSVEIYGAAGSVTNVGTLGGLVALQAGGNVTNGESGSTAGSIGRVRISGPGAAVNYGAMLDAEISGPGTVINLGTILGYAAPRFFAPPPTGIAIAGAGTIINDGSVSGTVSLSTGGVSNYGAITSMGLDIVPSSIAVSVGSGTVTNHGAITNRPGIEDTSQAGGVLAPTVSIAGAGAVTNFAAIADDGTIGADISLTVAATGAAVLIGGAAALTNYGTIANQVANYGTVETLLSCGLSLAAGGTVVNSGLITAGASNQGAGSAGLYTAGIYLGGAADATVVNSGVIAAGDGILVAGGAMFRQTVINSGTITGADDTGIVLTAGGFLYNNPGGSVTGVNAAVRGVAPTTVVNRGAVSVAGSTYSFGVYLAQGGTVDNKIGGTISAYDAGVVVNGGPGWIGNAGSIESTGSTGIGVYLGASGVSLANYGVVGGAYGIMTGGGDTAGDTIVNAGTIIGGNGTAVALQAGDLLVLAPSADFVGVVSAASTDTLGRCGHRPDPSRQRFCRLWLGASRSRGGLERVGDRRALFCQ